MNRFSLRISLLDTYERTIICFIIALLIYIFRVFIISFSNPVLDLYAFRQAQTAISAYWIAHGGAWLAYETPVLGSPWAIPFEFPLYQWLVALVSVAGLTINEAGRLISFVFYLITLWPVWIIMYLYRLKLSAFLIFSAIYLASPLYIFWGRSVMIETTAVFFSALWLAFFASAMFSQKKYYYYVSASIAGCLACLVKSTTFPGFIFIGGVIYIFAVILWRKEGVLRQEFPRVMGGLIVTAVPLVVGVIWVTYSDTIKMLNIVSAERLTSDALSRWSFGNIEQRISEKLWEDTIVDRSFPEILGLFWPIAIISTGVTFIGRLHFVVAMTTIFAFILVFMVFTNLHIVHNYYQVANGIFLICAVSIGIHLIYSHNRQIISLFLLALILTGQLIFFEIRMMPSIIAGSNASSKYKVSIEANKMTLPNQSIVVFGTDWSSEILYYAQRKGFAIPSWLREDLVRSVLADPARYLGNYSVGAFVDCFPDNSKNPQVQILKSALAGKHVSATFGSCRLILPSTSD